MLLHVLQGPGHVDVHEYGPRGPGAVGIRLHAERPQPFVGALENSISVLKIGAATEHRKGLALILGMQFLDPAGQHHVVSAQSHQRAGLLERGGGRGAGILHVDDGDAADAEFAQGNLAGDAGLARNHASADVSDPSGLQIAAFQVAIAKGA